MAGHSHQQSISRSNHLTEVRCVFGSCFGVPPGFDSESRQKVGVHPPSKTKSRSFDSARWVLVACAYQPTIAAAQPRVARRRSQSTRVSRTHAFHYSDVWSFCLARRRNGPASKRRLAGPGPANQLGPDPAARVPARAAARRARRGARRSRSGPHPARRGCGP